VWWYPLGGPLAVFLPRGSPLMRVSRAYLRACSRWGWVKIYTVPFSLRRSAGVENITHLQPAVHGLLIWGNSLLSPLPHLAAMRSYLVVIGALPREQNEDFPLYASCDVGLGCFAAGLAVRFRSPAMGGAPPGGLTTSTNGCWARSGRPFPLPPFCGRRLPRCWRLEPYLVTSSFSPHRPGRRQRTAANSLFE